MDCQPEVHVGRRTIRLQVDGEARRRCDLEISAKSCRVDPDGIRAGFQVVEVEIARLVGEGGRAAIVETYHHPRGAFVIVRAAVAVAIDEDVPVDRAQCGHAEVGVRRSLGPTLSTRG